jgi:glycosyltransferase involved in cell wall biosynthesis
MRVAIVAPPFIPVPPVRYGGTELFVAHLAEGLVTRGHDVTVYTNADSRVRCDRRWLFPHGEWPLTDPSGAMLKNADHTAWAIQDAARYAEVLHLNDAVGMPFTRFVDAPAVHTLHHPHEPVLSAMYERYPDVAYVAISCAQARREPMPGTTVVHHGIPLEDYEFRDDKDDYVAFLGRMVRCKGAHTAIEVARRAGLRLKLAGEVQPAFADYWRDDVLPHIDGDRIEYVGEAGREEKNALLSRARALLFPIDWEEPFGLVMIEAMACGTPVLAFAGGSVPEIVSDGVSGWMCHDVAEMVARAQAPEIAPESCRAWVASHFSRERMVDRYIDVYERVRSGRPSPIDLETTASWKT